MLGAILGDIIGSPYEFDENNIKTKDFPLFSKRSHFTDDTVMTLAVAQGFARGYNDKAKTKSEIIKSMRNLGLQFPNAGYGGRFAGWLLSDNPMPYNSLGNGSAMRVSTAAWFYDDIRTVEQYAEISAAVTHDHPEGIIGAKSTAAAVFLARQNKSKEYIKQYIEDEYHYDLSKSCDEIRPSYRFNEFCRDTVPQAITAFLESTDFEDAVRTAVSLGGDSDTLAAITGSIAEAYYTVPAELQREAINRLDPILTGVLSEVLSFLQNK